MYYRKRIWLFTTVYRVIAVVVLILLVLAAAFLFLLQGSIQPQYIYYGNDAVSGWATIFSGLGYLAAWFGKTMILLLVAFFVLFAGYWIIGLILNRILRRSIDNGSSVKGLGVALGIWTMIPGVLSLTDLVSRFMNQAAAQGSANPQLFFSAAFIGGGIYLLVTALRNEV